MERIGLSALLVLLVAALCAPLATTRGGYKPFGR
jgi:hypothetical protein